MMRYSFFSLQEEISVSTEKQAHNFKHLIQSLNLRKMKMDTSYIAHQECTKYMCLTGNNSCSIAEQNARQMQSRVTDVVHRNQTILYETKFRTFGSLNTVTQNLKH